MTGSLAPGTIDPWLAPDEQSGLGMSPQNNLLWTYTQQACGQADLTYPPCWHHCGPPSDNLNPKAHLAQIGCSHLILYPLADPLQLDCCLNEGWGACLKSSDTDLEIKVLIHELGLHLTWSSGLMEATDRQECRRSPFLWPPLSSDLSQGLLH